MDFINLKAQYQTLKNDIDKAIGDVIKEGRYINGPQVKELEQKLSGFTGVKHCIGCASGTDALFLSLFVFGIKEGDEVITTPFTFIATAETIALLKAKPVFVDIEEGTYNIDVSKLEEKITDKTKAIMPVSLYGQCCDMDEINQIAGKYDIPVIEDAAQSFGATYKDKLSCGLSTIGCTSFYPSKPLGCYGDGGALFTNDDDLAERLTKIRNHGQNKRYSHQVLGVNSRLDTIQAAILLTKMKIFKEEISKRKAIGKRYTELFKDNDSVIVPKVKEDRDCVYAQYSIRVKDRDKVKAYLNENGIPTAVHYPIPLYKQEVFSYLAENPSLYEVSEAVSGEIMSLPMSPYLTEEEQDTVVKRVNEITG